MKKIIKVCVFILIFVILLYNLIKILWLEKTPISIFYDEPQNSLDVIYIGSSNVYRHFNTVLAYNLYGYTTGLLSSDAQMPIFAKYLIKEAKQYQNPLLYVIDISKLADDFSKFSKGDIRKVIDSMKLSKNRTEAINDVLSYRENVTKRDYTNLYFSFFKYHNSWKFFPTSNMTGVKYLYKGFILEEITTKKEKQDVFYWSDEISNLQEENKKVLESLIKYIKEENINVLFVVPKRYFEKDTNERLNDAIQIIENNKLKVVNLNKIEDYNIIDYETDFYDLEHLNIYGSTKNTMVFSKYLKENYELPNHKVDSAYESWEKEYIRFKEDFSNITQNDFEEILNNYKEQYKD